MSFHRACCCGGVRLIVTSGNTCYAISTATGSTLWSVTSNSLWGRNTFMKAIAFDGGIAVVPKVQSYASGVGIPIEVTILDQTTGATLQNSTVTASDAVTTTLSTHIAHAAFNGEIYVLFARISGAASECVVLNNSLVEQRRFYLSGGSPPYPQYFNTWSMSLNRASHPLAQNYNGSVIYIPQSGVGAIGYYGYSTTDGVAVNRYLYSLGSGSSSFILPSRLCFVNSTAAVQQCSTSGLINVCGWGGPGTVTLWSSSNETGPAAFVRGGNMWHSAQAASVGYNVVKRDVTTGIVQWQKDLNAIDPITFTSTSTFVNGQIADGGDGVYGCSFSNADGFKLYKTDLEYTSIMWSVSFSGNIDGMCLTRAGLGFNEADFSAY